jgi:galactose mutarotase-like enzyme
MNEIELRSADARLRIATTGAECRSWSVGGRHLLWSPDAAIWDAVAPLLFPVCGWTRGGQMRIGGRTYPLGLHGFARQSLFRVAEAHADRARLALCDDAATRSQYPFAFELTATYALRPSALDVTLEVRNPASGPLPYAVGLHPGFRIDPRRPLTISFDEAEEAHVPVIAPGGLFSDRRRGIPLQGRRLALDRATFAQEALCFVPARSHGIELDQGDGTALRVEYPDFENLVLWSRPGAPFLCIEPWTGFGDPEGFAGDIFEKPGMRLLGPGESAAHRVRLIWRA